MRESVRTHRYFTIEEIYAEKDEMRRREMILSNKNVLLASIYKIYEKLRRENACFLVLFVQDVAKEELEKFCEHSQISKITIGSLEHIMGNGRTKMVTNTTG
ncbi:MAG TPA: hypothetical protein ENG66_08820 [Thermococcus sp.]|nr:hypothetical protein [Thermococcus sp.]